MAGVGCVGPARGPTRGLRALQWPTSGQRAVLSLSVSPLWSGCVVACCGFIRISHMRHMFPGPLVMSHEGPARRLACFQVGLCFSCHRAVRSGEPRCVMFFVFTNPSSLGV